MGIRRGVLGAVGVLAIAPLMGCGAPSSMDESAQTSQPYTSAIATLMNFEFDGELVSSTSVSKSNAPSVIRKQLYYTVGQLNGTKGVGRLDKLSLTNVTVETDANRVVHVRYHALLPVSWGNKSNLPATYSFILPRGADSSALDAFSEKYATTCVGSDAHDVGSGSFWYYYRPAARNCALVEEDIIRITASVSRSDENTTGKYPEYHRIWEDREFRMIAIFGKYEDGATEASDAGISAFNAFVKRMRSTFPQAVTEPPTLPSSVGINEPDIEFRAALSNGLEVRINTFLVDNIRTTPKAFNDRYNALSTEADLIAYNGHAGLGDNVAALSRKGSFRSGKYQIIFMNGCDTFAYVDGTLAQTRAKLNPDDPAGTKYMEIITNSMPSYFTSNATADTALITGLTNVAAPKTYEAMFRNIDSSQIVVVTGEEDNEFTPDMDGGAWPPKPPVPPEIDAGTPPTDDIDAGTPPTDPPTDDVDAGTPPTEPPPSIDAGSGQPPGIPPRDGCTCSLETGASSPRGAGVLLLLAGLATLRLRRKRA